MRWFLTKVNDTMKRINKWSSERIVVHCRGAMSRNSISWSDCESTCAPRLHFIHHPTTERTDRAASWVYERATNRRTGIERMAWQMREEKEKASGGRVKDRKGQRLRRPFWPLLVPASLATRCSKRQPRAAFDKTNRERGDEREEATGDPWWSRINSTPVRGFWSPITPRYRGGKRKRKKNAKPIYGDPLEQIDAANSREADCHSRVINCPVELGRDSNWIDYRYASGRMGGSGEEARWWRWRWCKRFIRFPARIGPESRRRDWKMSHSR